MKKGILYLIPLAALLASCGVNPNGNNPGGNNDTFTPDTGMNSDVSGDEIDVEIDDEDPDITDSEISSITDLTANGISYDETNKLFTITAAGEFVFTGEFNGNILVNAGDEDEVKVTLSNFKIASSKDSPIKCDNAGDFKLSIKNGTSNYVYDERSTKTVDNDSLGNGAVTSSCDMKLTGQGSLIVVGNYYNGIHCKDDLKIQPEVNGNSSVQIKAYNNALKGNDSVTIKSGNIVLIATHGNGILTESTDLSSSSKQRGNIEILGGHVDIYSAKDALDAAYNVVINDSESSPIVNIYTSKYSSYSEEVTETSNSSFYLRFNNNVNTSSYYYAVEFMNNDYSTKWVKASSVSSQSSYKYFSVDRPSNATSFKVCGFSTSVSSMSENSATYIMSNFKTLSSSYDTAKLGIVGSEITLDGWTNFSSSGRPGPGPGGDGPGGGGMDEGNNNKSEVSAKGIKADNEINISAGTFFIKTYDDAIHANYGASFESGSTGLGNVNISGGTFDIYASDDGIHADRTLNITGGNISIQYSYEGIEGNTINISGGETHVYSVDDGLNAAKKDGSTTSPSINISGGITDVTVYGQDVDGIDSNGTYTQTGGYVITKGGSGGMSTGLDCDGTAKVSGGTMVIFGDPEKTPSYSGLNNYTLTSTSGYSIGTYLITFADNTKTTVITKYSYKKINVYSDTSTKISVSKQ